MATLLIALAVGSTGLYAGFLLVFLTGIMPALGRLTDAAFVTAMRRVNEAVPRAVFLAVFVAAALLPLAAYLVPVEGRTETQRWLVLAGFVCAVLNHLVTVVGNVPLNNALAAAEGPDEDPSATRAAFEARWNGYHRIRTALILVSFGLLTAAAVG
ncbi:anthrone oxygenase family protein [Streptomyces sp. NPDC047974]|uniref:anthrone oxygenase family protein n=1 Tax=Streptomyces sp. NPDC047974 TaxID=3154343 RepID=UPI00340127A7